MLLFLEYLQQRILLTMETIIKNKASLSIPVCTLIEQQLHVELKSCHEYPVNTLRGFQPIKLLHFMNKLLINE